MNAQHEPNRVGDLAEHYAITWLWDNGYHVFKNCQHCTGPVDIVAMNPEGEITLIDVKSYKDGRLSAKDSTSERTWRTILTLQFKDTEVSIRKKHRK